ncbi:uncharacterized protein LOC127262672 isoform X3 [Andrographis paniculata]|uniref:uncharacterized protein LOC127262672 isoform X3 n=1 Tax=Andrographis paniculata TaxID=175694 RepID=UPI0021E921A3|nr:uncharacterized protein LOC127262672 isoform X3 [Andrographis paniculata]
MTSLSRPTPYHHPNTLFEEEELNPKPIREKIIAIGFLCNAMEWSDFFAVIRSRRRRWRDQLLPPRRPQPHLFRRSWNFKDANAIHLSIDETLATHGKGLQSDQYGATMIPLAPAGIVNPSVVSVTRSSRTRATPWKLPEMAATPGEVRIRKWNGPDKISKIYGDWIDDL